MPPRGSPMYSRLPYGAHVILLFVCCFAAFILIILVTFSSPFISSINFLRLPAASGPTTFGSFGWCAPGYCLPSQISYEYGTEVNKALTGAMFLWPMAVIFTFFTLLAILPLLFVHESRALRWIGNRQFFLFSADLATILVVTAWLFSIYGWSIAHRAFEVAGTDVHLGSAIWMGLVAAILMVIITFLNWPKDAWDGTETRATGQPGRGLPAPPPGTGYYHYKRTTREVVPRV
ncbi:hypothetical protein Q5752_001548 [Cryptotrichosporon argae]